MWRHLRLFNYRNTRPMPDASHAITELDAAAADAHGAIQSVRIVKNEGLYTLHLQFSWRKDEVFMATVRERTTPKQYKSLDRLVEYIAKDLPSVRAVRLELAQTPPAAPRARQPRAAKEVAH